MKDWYLVGNMGGTKMLYYVGKFDNESDARFAAKKIYKLKKDDFKMEAK